jgi:hypothetical protein
MDQLIDSIRAAMADGADDNSKQAGANACRAILAALEAREGAPLANTPPASPLGSNIATAVSALRNVPPDQLLDLVIAKLRARLPEGAAVAPTRAVSFQLVPVAALPNARGGR